jgi:hypothetical protein
MTRMEAAKKTCPILPPHDNGVVTSNLACLVSGCMMWREEHFTIDNETTIDGYCGMAGEKNHL